MTAATCKVRMVIGLLCRVGSFRPLATDGGYLPDEGVVFYEHRNQREQRRVAQEAS